MNIFVEDNCHIEVNDNAPHVTVLIPLYNGIEYLEQSALSVVQQTYARWQLIIGINGHPEGSDIEARANTIIESININKKYDILVKYYDTSGKSKTLNKMVGDAKYDYIAILDVDDYWTNDKLEMQIPFLKNYDVVGAKCEYFGEKSGSPPIPLGDFSSKHNIFEYNPIINSSAIIHKRDAIWDDEQYIPAVIGLDDYSMWFKLYFLERKFYNIDKVLCYHRVHNDSAFNTENNNRVTELKNMWYAYFRSHKY